MKTILLFAGTRPEIIKMAPLIRELRERQSSANGWKVHFCFSGQHIDLALPFLKYFDIEPDSRLELMNPGQSLGQLTAQALSQIDNFLTKQENVCAALVQGDTTTASAAALSAFYHQIPVGHVEAGLRTSNINEPFPEELNRRMISQMATWNFAPTQRAKETLLSEKLRPESIFVTGNTGIDSFLWALSKTQTCENKKLNEIAKKKIVLITVHRRENLEDRLPGILKAIADLAEIFKDVNFIFPVHPNPKISNAAKENFQNHSTVFLVEPLSYGDLVWVFKKAELVLTDSGGIQEEAPSLLKPILVLREDTERPEAVEFGTSIMVGTSQKNIVETAQNYLSGVKKISPQGQTNPFGDGKAAQKIADCLLQNLHLV